MSKGMLGASPGGEHLGLVIDFTSKLQSGAITPMAAKRFLRGEVPQAKLPVWKTIKLGTNLKTFSNFYDALQGAGCRFNSHVSEILKNPKFVVAVQKTEIDLVVVSVAELGFKDEATNCDIYRRAQELGLLLCPAEVGPQLRLQYLDQPDGFLIIGMEPIFPAHNKDGVFSIEHYKGQCILRTVCARPGYHWNGEHRFVFVSRK